MRAREERDGWLLLPSRSVFLLPVCLTCSYSRITVASWVVPCQIASRHRIRKMNRGRPPCKNSLMFHLLKFLVVLVVRSFRTRRALLLQNLVLRQQLAVLTRLCPQPRFAASADCFGCCCGNCGMGDGGSFVFSSAVATVSALVCTIASATVCPMLDVPPIITGLWGDLAATFSTTEISIFLCLVQRKTRSVPTAGRLSLSLLVFCIPAPLTL
jgi:hypothetical protein